MRLCWWIFKLERCHKVYVLCSAKIIWPIQVHFLCTKMDTLMTQNWWNTNQGQGKQALKRQKKAQLQQQSDDGASSEVAAF